MHRLGWIGIPANKFATAVAERLGLELKILFD